MTELWPAFEDLPDYSGDIRPCLSVSGIVLSEAHYRRARQAMIDELNLRDAIRLLVGYKTCTPWPEVPQSEVDAWVDEIRRLKNA